MKFKVFIASVFFICSLLPGISPAQNKVVVIPLLSDCSDEIPTVTSASGRVWMDRNLGASKVAESQNDHGGYGWLYQWGRLTDGHEIRFSPTTTTLSRGDVPGHGDFIKTSSSPFNWRSSRNDNLWQGVPGVNTPCPAGFRLPTETEWQTERASWVSSDLAGAFASPLKLVAAGNRRYSDGLVYAVGASGSYWSSTVSSVYARSLNFNINDAFMGTYSRAQGFSVRCIKD